MERQIGNCKQILLFQRSRVLFPEPISNDSQLAVVPIPVDTVPSAGLCGHHTHMLIPLHRYTHILLKNLVVKEKKQMSPTILTLWCLITWEVRRFSHMLLQPWNPPILLCQDGFYITNQNKSFFLKENLKIQSNGKQKTIDF